MTIAVSSRHRGKNSCFASLLNGIATDRFVGIQSRSTGTNGSIPIRLAAVYRRPETAASIMCRVGKGESNPERVVDMVTV
jgi:hypothetical protein